MQELITSLDQGGDPLLIATLKKALGLQEEVQEQNPQEELIRGQMKEDMKKIGYEFKKELAIVKQAANHDDLVTIINKQLNVIKAGLHMSEIQSKDKNDQWKRVVDRISQQGIDNRFERDVVAQWGDDKEKTKYLITCIQSLRKQPDNPEPS